MIAWPVRDAIRVARLTLYLIKIHYVCCKTPYNNRSIPWRHHRGPITMKSSFLNTFSLIGALCLSLYSSNALATQYYKWVDAKGSTHYSKNPPPKTAKKATTVHTYGWKNSAPTPSRPTENETQPENTPQEPSPPTQVPAAQDQQQREANEALDQSKNRGVAL